jgi:hypothetical protein
MSQEVQNIIILLSIFGVVAILTLIVLLVFTRRVKTTIETRKQVREEQRYRELNENFSSVVDKPYEPQLQPEEIPPRAREREELP